MGFVTPERWALRDAVDAKGKRRAWGVDFGAAEISGGNGRPRCGLKLWGQTCGISLRSHKDKKLKIKETAKGWKFDLANPGELIVEEKDSLTFPTGEIWTPEFGILSANLVIAKKGEYSWQFDLDIPGASYAYQPALTPAEIDRGCVRPAWAVGSWAVFDSGGRKIAHISNAFARDATGVNWTWGTVGIENGILTVTMPKEWMDSAVYPVTVDPDLGRTTTGASSVGQYPDYLVAFMAGGGLGVATAIHYYCNANPAVPVTLGAYKRDGTRAGYTAGGNSPTSAGWLSQDFSTQFSLENGECYFSSEVHGTSNLTAYYDTDANSAPANYYYAASSYSAGSMPSPCPSLTSANLFYNFSIHIVATDPVFPDPANVRNKVVFGAASELEGTLVVLGHASGSATLAKETGANARGGSGTCAKLTPTSASVYGYWDFVVKVPAVEFKLSFYYKSFHTTTAWNGTLKVSLWDSDDPAESPPPLLNAVDVAGTYDATYRLWESAAKTAAAEGLCRVRIEIVNGADSGGVYIDDIAVTAT